MRARNWAEERRARELRKLLAEVDPPRRVIRELSYLILDPMAKPRTFNHVKDGQGYVPEKPAATRSGADTHQRYKSKGF
jgi:hypothetical protein